MCKFNLFSSLGNFIGSHPVAVLIFSFLLIACSGGILKIELRDKVREGWTPTTSKSRYETDVLKSFYNSSEDPMCAFVVLQARDNGSMHRIEYLKAATDFYKHVSQELALKDSTNKDNNHGKFTYMDICGPFCNDNMQIVYFKEILLGMVSGRLPVKEKLGYPIAHFDRQSLHLQPNFYGVKVLNGGQNLINGIADPEILRLSLYTEIVYVKAIMMTFRANLLTEQDTLRAQQWELALYDYAKAHFHEGSTIQAFVLGDSIVNHEVMEDGKKTTAPVLVAGLILMLIFVIVAIAFESLHAGVHDCCGKVAIIAIVALLCPMLAVSTTLGLWSLAGARTNSAMLIMPLLILGIGVDDAFLTTHAWISTTSKGLTSERRIAFIVEEVGPSVTITTVTNVLTFIIGALTPTLEIRLFCASAAIALTFTYIYTFSIFLPCLCLISRQEEKSAYQIAEQYQNGKLKKISRALLQAYCCVISNCCFKFIIFCVYIAYISFSVYGAITIRTKLDTEEILPHDSPIKEPNRIISELVWTEYYPVTVFINNPLDITKQYQLNRRFNLMIEKFEQAGKCKGKEFTISWLRDFEAYSTLNRQYPFIKPDEHRKTPFNFCKATMERRTETGLNYYNLGAFFNSKFYQHYAHSVKMAPTEQCVPIPIRRFMLLVTFHNTTSWQDRIELMLKWRSIVEEFPDLNATVWEANGMFVDQMLSLKGLAIETIISTLLFMALVCALFMHNLFSVLTAVWAIGSISVGVIGLLSLLFGLDLNPITLCTILMCIGMSVDFTAHTSYHFQLRSRHKPISNGVIIPLPLSTHNEKLWHCVKSIAWPMLLAGTSTTIAVLPLALLRNYIPLAFFKTITLVVLCGIFHGLILLPCLLTSVPMGMLEFGIGCCGKGNSEKDEASPNGDAQNEEASAMNASQNHEYVNLREC